MCHSETSFTDKGESSDIQITKVVTATALCQQSTSKSSTVSKAYYVDGMVLLMLSSCSITSSVMQVQLWCFQ
jgi:hypothetical protein